MDTTGAVCASSRCIGSPCTSTQAFAVCGWKYCTMGVPFLHAPVRQRVGLGLGPMRGQGTQARRAAGQEWYLRAGGEIIE